jgi:hypothetical protein
MPLIYIGANNTWYDTDTGITYTSDPTITDLDNTIPETGDGETDPPPEEDIGIVPTPVVNNTSPPTPINMDVLLAGANSPLGIPYGRCRIPFQPILIRQFSFPFVGWLFLYKGGVGEVGDIHKIEVDGRQLTPVGMTPGTPIGGGNLTGSQGRLIYWNGSSTQNVSTWVTPYVPGYPDALPGVVMFGLLMNHDKVGSQPPIVSAVFDGLEMTDPRGGTTRLGNNALVIKHYIENYHNRSVNDASVIAHANSCDEIVPGGDKRRTLNIFLNKVQDTQDTLNNLAAHSGVYLFDDGDEIQLIPNRPASSTFTITEDDIIGQTKIKIASLANRPKDVKCIGYNHTLNKQIHASAVGSGNDERLSRVDLPGVDNYEQLHREAIERFNHLSLEPWTIYGTVVDKGIEIAIGDVGSYSDSRVGLTNQLVRVVGIRMLENRYDLVMKNYDANSYSDSVQTDPNLGGADLDDPLNPPTPTWPNPFYDDYVNPFTWIQEVITYQPDYTFVASVLIEHWNTAETQIFSSIELDVNEMANFPFTSGDDMEHYVPCPNVDHKVRVAFRSTAGVLSLFTAFKTVTIPDNYNPRICPLVAGHTVNAQPDSSKTVTFNNNGYLLFTRFTVTMTDTNSGDVVHSEVINVGEGETSWTTALFDPATSHGTGDEDTIRTDITAENVNGLTSDFTESWIYYI